MNANATGFRLGSWLDPIRRLPAVLANAVKAVAHRALTAQPSKHSRLGKWETLASPAARALMQTMHRHADVVGRRPIGAGAGDGVEDAL